MDEKNGGPLSVLHVSKRGIFRFGFQNLGETSLGVLLGRPMCHAHTYSKLLNGRGKGGEGLLKYPVLKI